MSPTTPPHADIYLVGKHVAETAQGNVWEVDSLWTTFDSAAGACRDGDYFVAPMPLNQAGPHETAPFPWMCFPRDEEYPHIWYPEA